jgi:hypothetical protein
MSGSNSFVPGSNAVNPSSPTEELPDSPLNMAVHSMQPELIHKTADSSSKVQNSTQRTARGRWKMFLVLAVCAAPVVASYLTYFVIRPQGRINYSELVLPSPPLPADLPLTDLQGAAVNPASLKGQWLLLVVAAAACDAACEKHLWLQRQLRETLGREKNRVDKVWLIPDTAPVRTETLNAIRTNTQITVLRLPRAALAAWLAPVAGQALENHIYIINPQGEWMMRSPIKPEPAKLKRDIEKLLRASAGWDKAGR